MLAVDHAVAVLHAGDVDDLTGLGEFVDGDLGQSYVADLALDLQLPKRAQLVGERDGRIDAMQLEQVEPVEPEPTQTLLDLIPQKLRTPTDHAVLWRVRWGHTDLGRDEEVIGIGVQRLGEKLLVGTPPVQVRGVDQGHAQLDGPPCHRDAGFPAHRLVRPQAHRPEPEPSHREFIPDTERGRCHPRLPLDRCRSPYQPGPTACAHCSTRVTS
ncbi:hypothetical protein [Alloactinosynnema sp. L-07]|nr:hypothetical protein [Alloactinosynnema sp. L-07]